MSTYTVMVKLTIRSKTKAAAARTLMRLLVLIDNNERVVRIEHGPIARDP